MPVKIRLKRMGAKKRPFYHVVIADSRSPRERPFHEQWVHSNHFNLQKSVDEDKILAWLNNGAMHQKLFATC